MQLVPVGYKEDTASPRACVKGSLNHPMYMPELNSSPLQRAERTLNLSRSPSPFTLVFESRSFTKLGAYQAAQQVHAVLSSLPPSATIVVSVLWYLALWVLRIRTQIFMVAEQALYSLNYTSSPYIQPKRKLYFSSLGTVVYNYNPRPWEVGAI